MVNRLLDPRQVRRIGWHPLNPAKSANAIAASTAAASGIPQAPEVLMPSGSVLPRGRLVSSYAARVQEKHNVYVCQSVQSLSVNLHLRVYYLATVLVFGQAKLIKRLRSAAVQTEDPIFSGPGTRELVTACCTFGNSFTLPLVFMMSLFPQSAFDRAVGYTALFLASWSPCLWGFGYQFLSSAAVPTSEGIQPCKIRRSKRNSS